MPDPGGGFRVGLARVLQGSSGPGLLPVPYPSLRWVFLCFCLSVCAAIRGAGHSGAELVSHWLLASPGNRPGRVRAARMPPGRLGRCGTAGGTFLGVIPRGHCWDSLETGLGLAFMYALHVVPFVTPELARKEREVRAVVSQRPSLPACLGTRPGLLTGLTSNRCLTNSAPE